MVDEVVRSLVLWSLIAGLLLMLVGGFVRSLAGVWHDGDRRIVVRQYGCIVRADGYVDGGKQVYRGFAMFGLTRLTRYDFGGMHLGSLGFRHEQWPALHGQPMGHFHLRLRGSQLVGTFYGRRFTFVGAQLSQSRITPGLPRHWDREV